MGGVNDVERDFESIRLPEWGRVVATDDGMVPFVVVDPDGCRVEPIQRFLREFLARDRSRGSVRSYAFDLHRRWRFLAAAGVSWDQPTSVEVPDFELWLGQADKQHRHHQRPHRGLQPAAQTGAIVEHRDDLAKIRTQTINRLHVVLTRLVLAA